MTVTVCIGSSCHLKGSKSVIEELQRLITENNLTDKIELKGSFCMGNCENGVSVLLDEKLISMSPENVEEIFNRDILPNV